MNTIGTKTNVIENNVPTAELIRTGIDVRQFGAKGDDLTDDTAAIQRAIDTAARCRGGVWFPPGVYQTSRLKLHPGVALVADPTWNLHPGPGTVLKLIDDSVPCLLDLSLAFSARIRGLSLDGQNIGRDTVGVFLDGALRAPEHPEDLPFLEDCSVRRFSGHGAHFKNCFAFMVRNSLFSFNSGSGVVFNRWDGFFYENIFNNNKGYGIAGLTPCASVTILGNRIEWNNLGGIYLEDCWNCQIGSNYIDRSGKAGLYLHGSPGNYPLAFTVIGNIFNRSGVLVDDDDPSCCHARVESIEGLVMTGNVFKAHYGFDDTSSGRTTPATGIRYQNLRGCIIKDNVLAAGATKKLMEDLGGHDEATIVRDNVGRLSPTS